MAERIKCIEIWGSNGNITKSKMGIVNITIPIINIKLLSENPNYETYGWKIEIGWVSWYLWIDKIDKIDKNI